jgi:hypothetical protein
MSGHAELHGAESHGRVPFDSTVRCTMRSRLLLAAAALLTLAACSESATAPRSFKPTGRSADESPGPDGACRSGYELATRSDGTTVCVPG